jgi:23S rRNA (pseudouridine1915-N3)-methyltransferase
MMDMICVGKLTTKGYKETFDHYFKQLQKIKVIEIKESDMVFEAKLILKAIDLSAHIVVLAIEGETFDSVGFAESIRQKLENGKKIQFIIGGSDGLHESIKSKAHQTLSMSRMTFPHQLARIMLIEQIYRSIKIIENHPYHK